MATLAPVPSWIPEDDLLLKNAVESGASLEALARGAVRFSRKFTVRELRDRWHSLLYDPVISTEASARMIEFEHSAPSSSSKANQYGASKEVDVPSKRKAESIRRQYYARKKRIRSEALNPFDLSCLGEPDAIHCVGNGGVGEEEHMGEDNLEYCGNSTQPPCVLRDMVVWKGAGQTLVVDMSEGQDEEETLKDEQVCGEMMDTNSFSGVDFADISDSLLNIPNEEELPFMEADGKDSMESILLSSPKDVLVDNISDVCDPQPTISNESHSIAEDVCLVGLGSAADLTDPVPGDLQTVCHSEVHMQSSKSIQHYPRLCGGEIICVLNTEDTEIPCNDNIFLCTSFSSSSIKPSFEEDSYQGSSYAIRRISEQELRLKKEENLSSVTESHILGSGFFRTNPKDSHLGYRDKNEHHPVSASRQVDSVAGPSYCRSTHGTPTPASDTEMKKEGVQPPVLSRENVLSSAAPGSSGIIVPECEAEHDDREGSDFDNDIPSFSDIETMILEMDLCPNEEDSYVNKEVARYQNEDAKRKIVRMEQCARSFIRRAIASQGAFAVLYGRNLKQYIRKTEVILGRATDDVEVDIDLSREGHANKISRRQAVIKMEKDGSFILKNFGKSSIFLNGREVARGQLATLASNSLIEIREMAFVFEVNHKSVRRYLANGAQKSRQSNNGFEWLPEGIHA